MLKKRTLGRTGFEVTEMGYGAWAIGGSGYGVVDESQGRDCLTTYLEAGGNFIDTARAYGHSEKVIGDTLAANDSFRREDIFIATKTQSTGSEDRFPRIRKDLEESLRLLRCDYIDLYFMHSPPSDPDTMNRVFDIFEELKAEGKIRAIGASIKGPSVTDETVALWRQYIDCGRCDAIQLIYSIMRQRAAEVFDEAKQNGVGIVARTVIESGFLSGRYKAGSAFSDHRKRWTGERLAGVLGLAEEVCSFGVRAPYQSMAQTAIRFALESEGVSTVIAGGRTAEQVRANMEVDGLPPLEADLLERFRRDYADITDRFNPNN